MNSWAPLWSGLVDSSIWEEEDHVFMVFMAMLSLKDSQHVVSMDSYRLARRIHMNLEDVEAALRVLSSPDRRRPDQPFEGRRIQRVEEGWEIINGEEYRRRMSEEMKRARNRRNQAAHRARKAEAKESSKARTARLDEESRERRFVDAVERGDEELADQIVDRTEEP